MASTLAGHRVQARAEDDNGLNQRVVVIIQKVPSLMIVSPFLSMYGSLHPNFSSTANVAPKTGLRLHVRLLATNMFLKTQ